MNFGGIIENDIVDSDCGICVSLFVSYCPHRCKGCHNKELWEAKEKVPRIEIENKILSLINKNGIKRNFSVLGGEPLCDENIREVSHIINKVKKNFPDIKIYVWTGYIFDDLKKKYKKGLNKIAFKKILENIDILIDGPYIETLRDTRLKLRGSSNQRILRFKKGRMAEIVQF